MNKKLLLEKAKHIKEKYLIETVILVIAALILINTLFIYPILGRADNGDFGRLFLYGGLKDLGNTYEERFDGYFHVKYMISHAGILLPWGPNWVFGAVILKIAFAVNLVLGGFLNGIFDIRYQTILYCVLFLAAVFYILRFNKLNSLTKIILGSFMIIFFTDINYILYFNSFFGEAATIVFFFLTIGTFFTLISNNNPSKRDFTFFFVASAGFLTSKTQQIPLLLFMIIIYYGLHFYYKDAGLGKFIKKASLFVVLFCAATYFSIDGFTNKNNIYQAVFTGVLRGSETPKQDLRELGLNEKFASLAGTGFYDRNLAYDPLGQEMLEEFYPNASRGKIVMFYVNHLDRLWEKIDNSAKHAYEFYKLNDSNFLRGQYNPNKKVNKFRTNLIDKIDLIHHNVYFFLIFSILFLASIVLYFIKYKDRTNRLLTLLMLFILAAGTSQFILPVLGSGEADFGKHLFLIALAFDTMYGITIVWFVNIALNLTNKIFTRKKLIELTQ